MSTKIAAHKAKGRPQAAFEKSVPLQRRLDLESPRLEQRLRDVLRILVAPCPLPETVGSKVLVRGELVLSYDLLEFGNGRGDRSNRLGFAPVGISASSCHESVGLAPVINAENSFFYRFVQVQKGFTVSDCENESCECDDLALLKSH